MTEDEEVVNVLTYPTREAFKKALSNFNIKGGGAYALVMMCSGSWIHNEREYVARHANRANKENRSDVQEK